MIDPQVKQLVATLSAAFAGISFCGKTTSAQLDPKTLACGFVPGLGALWFYGAGGQRHAAELRSQIDPVLFPALAGAGLYGAVKMFAPKKEKQMALLSAASIAVLAAWFNRKPSAATVGMLPERTFEPPYPPPFGPPFADEFTG